MNDARNDIIAGSCRGIAQIIVGHPLDTIKVRLQTQNRLISTGKQSKFNSLYECFHKTIKNEGWRGLWKGCTSPLAGCAFYSASLFFAYGQSKKLIGLDENNPKLTSLLIIGGITGGSAAFIECPIDTIKARLQVQYRNNPNGKKIFYTGSLDCGKHILQEKGISGIYQGLSATILRNIPGSMAYFTSYELIKRFSLKHNLSPSFCSFIGGGIAGIIFWGTIFPLDVVKSCIQTDHLYKSKRVYPTIQSAFYKIYKQQGFKGFWKGFSACCVRAFPCNAASFVVYENVRKRLPK